MSIIGILLYEILKLKEELAATKQSTCTKIENTLKVDTNGKMRKSLNQFSPNQDQLQIYLNQLRASGSSVWCWGTKHTNRICHFRHLCYVSDVQSFVFFHGTNSTIVGVPKDRFDPALLDLSSVENHNAKYFNFVDVPLWAVDEMLFNVDVIEMPSLMFSRFHPDNIMHVIHDDLFPLYITLQMLQFYVDDSFDVQLLFADGHNDGEYSDLYEMFTTCVPIELAKLAEDNMPSGRSGSLCFSDVYVGLSKHSTWYQYGFYEPQGPLPHATVTSQDIHQFTRFILRKLRITNNKQNDQAVLVTRKETRLIINDMELCLALSKHLQMKVVTVSLETHSIEQVVDIFNHATLIIGMHGSLLVFSMFLPAGGIIIELFPFGINPEHYTPYRTLAKIPQMDLVYRSWQNSDRSKSIPHPDRPKELGGIHHLSEEEQYLILDSNQVAPHLCCSDPAWLFHIYQDTIVNVDDVLALVDSGLNERQEILKNRSLGYDQSKQEMDSTFTKHPAPVDIICGITCNSEIDVGDRCPSSLHCHWKSPWNSKYIGDVTYEIWVQKVGENQYKTYSVSTNEFSENVNFDKSAQYYVWIRAFVDGVPGSVTFTNCNMTLLTND
ncbi:hypothetical protein LSH36_428g01060 [Paralvinella palmiformis]|uniref:Glycosyltransferase 61 catalytic domain-containing protein n=1 Tax=Paralvinella palmiformis TaxID=53620 RepID=A0AAD9JBM5_9ANNE|nr:hypothetical protein LSH36_428g01060 [Paralvinella palmiformis]